MPTQLEAKLIAEIESGGMTEEGLIALHRNAESKGSIAVMDAVKQRLQADFPRAYDRIFGSFKSQALAKLEEVNARLKRDFVLDGNRHVGEVKAGGSQRNRASFIDYYLSYKNQNDVKISLGIFQESRSTELLARVGCHDMARTIEPTVTVFKMDRFDDAEALYRQHLKRVLAA